MGFIFLRIPVRFTATFIPSETRSNIMVPRERERNHHHAPKTMNPATRSYHITTFGCQMNKADSERMAGILTEMGFEWCEDPFSADLVLYNTFCSAKSRIVQVL